MPRSFLITYEGLTMNKQQRANFLGLSIGSFNKRFEKYYPERLDKVFSEVYLTPGANMSNENILQAKTRVKESSRKQYKLTALQNSKKRLSTALQTVNNEISRLDWR